VLTVIVPEGRGTSSRVKVVPPLKTGVKVMSSVVGN